MPDGVELDWALAERALPGEDVSGDACLVRPSPAGTLVVTVDGLGHGEDAAVAARTAVEVAGEYHGDAILPLFERCHERLRRTRGVVLTAAWLDAARPTLTWAGVGNVDGVLVRADPEAERRTENVLLRGGVVGYQLPPIRPTTTDVAPGDMLVFATDGIDRDFVEDVGGEGEPQEVAEAILERHAKEGDDALVVVARYGGPRR